MSKTRKADPQAVWFAWLAVLIHLPFCYAALHGAFPFNGDSGEYVYAASNLLAGKGWYAGSWALPYNITLSTLRTPGYPVFLAVTYTFSDKLWLLLLLQQALSIWNILMARRLLLLLGGSPQSSYLLLLFVAGFPIQMVYANTIAPDILLQTCVMGYVLGAVHFLRRPALNSLLGMTIALALGVLVKPVLYPYCFIHALAFGGLLLFRHRAGSKMTALALVPAGFVILWGLNNQRNTGVFHLSSIQAQNALYYHHNFQASQKGVPAAKQFLRREQARIMQLPTFADQYKAAEQRGISLLRESPTRYLLYHLKMSLRFLIEPGKAELDLFSRRLQLSGLYDPAGKGVTTRISEQGVAGFLSVARQQTTLLVALGVGLLNVFRLIGMLLWMRRRESSWLLRLFLGLFIAYFALITGPITAAHYVLPVSLVMGALAVLGFQKNNRMPSATSSFKPPAA